MICTGYTAPVQRGEITDPVDYLHTCARAFLMHMRDAPKGTPITIPARDPSMERLLDEAKARLHHLENMTEADRIIAWQEYRRRAAETQARILADNEAQRSAVLTMASKLEAVDCGPALRPILDFALNQLRSVLGQDFVPKPDSRPAKAWYADELASARIALRNQMAAAARYEAALAETRQIVEDLLALKPAATDGR